MLKIYVGFVYIGVLVIIGQETRGQDLKREIFEDALAVWQAYRDPGNGLWCDTLRFGNQGSAEPIVTCGANNNFYSSAGTGMLDLILYSMS